MLLRVVSLLVDAQDDGHVFILGRRRYDDLLHRVVQVLGGIIAVGEQPCGLDDDLRANRCPVNLSRIAFREDLKFIAVDRDGFVAGLDVGVQVSQAPSRT